MFVKHTKEELKIIGQRCQEFRAQHNYLQSKVAEDTGYSIESVSAFENGRNDCTKIFLWYVARGLDISKVV